MLASLSLRLNSLAVVRHSDTRGGFISASDRQFWGSFSPVCKAVTHSTWIFLQKPADIMKFFFLQEQITNHFKFKNICRGRALFSTLEMRHFFQKGYQSAFSSPSQLLLWPAKIQWKLESTASQRGEILLNMFLETSWP